MSDQTGDEEQEGERARGGHVPLPPKLLAYLQDRLEELTLPEIRSRLGSVGMDRSEATISRFLSGATTTLSMLRALARVIGIPDPVVIVEHPDDLLWLSIGQGIRDIDPDKFQVLLRDWSAWVAAKKAQLAGEKTFSPTNGPPKAPVKR